MLRKFASCWLGIWMGVFGSTVVSAQSQTLANNNDEELSQRLNQAAVAISVNVTQALDNINVALSKGGVYTSDRITYSVIVNNVLKGESDLEPGQLVHFDVTYSQCYRIMATGGQYVLFMDTSNPSTIELASCDQILELAEDGQFAASFNPNQ